MPSGTGISRYTTDEGFTADVKLLLSGLLEDYPEINFEVPMLHPNPYEYFTEGGRHTCPAGSTVCVVRLDGRVIPCNQFLDTKMASAMSVKKHDIHHIWINDPVLSDFRKGSPSLEGLSCEGCAYIDRYHRFIGPPYF
jgi:radical SAM protein with 4Fe4S-binding SPASM domain